MIATPLASASRSPVGAARIVQVVELLDSISPAQDQATISFLTRLLALTPIERHVLACVATHCWTHRGSIPYHPPTAYQAAIARDLAGPGMRLLLQRSTRKPTYILSRVGELVARRVLHVVTASADQAREREFDRMRALMRNDWETDAVADEATGDDEQR